MNARTQRARQLRRDATHAERHLWRYLRARRLAGYHFKRQQPIGPYVADFCCHQQRLIIEVDGPIHQTRVQQDQQRTAFLQTLGYTVLRFSNNDVILRTESVLQAILDLSPSPSPKGLSLVHI